MSAPASPHVVVIGAGIIGASLAVELTRRGCRVTLVEPEEPGGRHAASFGNGAFISPASILPMSFPGMWRRVPGYLLDRKGPLTIRWRQLPQLSGWLWRFLLSGATPARYARTAGLLNGLLQDAPRRHLALAAQAGVPDLIRQEGLIYAFRDRAAMAGEAAGWALRRENGVRLRELEAEALAELLPDLAPFYRFGLMVEDGAHCLDPGAYVAALVDHARASGALLTRARATGFVVQGGHLQAVDTSAGRLSCDAAVIAAGLASAGLAARAGDRVSLAAERGYHVELSGQTRGPRIPVMPQDGKMANTLTRTGLRAAGQVEMTLPESPPDWRRADILLGHLRTSYPDLGEADGGISRWYGHRPSTPDGLPVISPASSIKGLFHAFGHGHVGLAAAPRTADLIAELILGAPAPETLAPFSVRRFR